MLDEMLGDFVAAGAPWTGVWLALLKGYIYKFLFWVAKKL
jgi:hypothetical protein